MTIQVEYLDHLGDDLTIVNSARVSMGKHRENMSSRDVRLIKYLINHGHWSPFEHCYVTFRVTCPIFIARQIFRHKSHSFNEISGRYVEFKKNYFTPKTFRKGSADIKQGSLNESVDDLVFVDTTYHNIIENCYKAYDELLEAGLCKELARGVLPQAHCTEFFQTMSLRSFIHFYQARTHEGAQRETSLVAQLMMEELKSRGLFYNTLKILKGEL